MITPESRPRLAPKARLRFDRKTDRWMLLFPEKGMELSATAAEIVKLLDGERTVTAIVDHLLGTYVGGERASVESHVIEFLSAMSSRALLETS